MITFEQVSKTYPNGFRAVCDLSMEIADGETVVLLGTSGCGKTTTMKMVNRLIDVSKGRITIDGEDIAAKDPIALRRKIGYAIQHIGLFPHMTVGDNIAVVPRMVGWDAARIDERVERLLTTVGLEPSIFRDRFPAQLSGGQMQRVGVARALAADPPIILMDEPFGALDPITRGELQDEFIDLQGELHKTIIFVTHDVFEAVKMGTRIAVLDRGEVQQLATPTELVERPANEFVDQFLGPQRFQLSLVTRTVKSVMPARTAPAVSPKQRPALFLRARSSLIEAMDVFKKANRDELPVWEAGAQVGTLGRGALLDAVTDALKEAGGQS
jgi:osmoprotectant transport system ATP-binding protein